MSCAKIEHWTEARDALAKAQANLDEPYVDFARAYGGGYGAWTIAEYLLQEAKAVVQPGS